MKKIMLLFSLVSIILLLSACMADENDSSEPELPAESYAEESEEASLPDYETISKLYEEYKAKYSELTDSLDFINDGYLEYETELLYLESLIKTLKKDLSYIIPGGVSGQTIQNPIIKKIYIKDNSYLSLYYDSTAFGNIVTSLNCATSLSLFKDGKEIKIAEGILSSIEVSPDKTRVVFNSGFNNDTLGTIFIYDIKNNKLQELTFNFLKHERTPACIKWLDDRYFLFSTQITESGILFYDTAIHAYDTQYNSYKTVLLVPAYKLGVYQFEVGSSKLWLNCIYNNPEKDAKDLNTLYSILPYNYYSLESIYEAIKSNQPIYVNYHPKQN